MRNMVVAAALVMLAACNPFAPPEPQVDQARVDANRATIASCEADGWTKCQGGFVRFDDNRVLDIVLNRDPARQNEAIGDNSITSGFLSSVKNDDLELNGFVIILVSERGAFEEAAVAHALQRTAPQAEVLPPAEDAKQ